MKQCLWCKKTLEGRKTKYCNELCRYRYLSMVNDNPNKFSKSQHLRINRSNRRLQSGRLGVRFN